VHVVPGLFCIGIGAVALVALKGNRETRGEMQEWPSAPGQITDRALERRAGGSKGGYVYVPAFRYAYSVDGVEHTGDTRDLSWSTGSMKWLAARQLAKVPDAVPVLYDPEDPAKSALTPPGKSDVWVWGLIGVALIALGVFFFVT
jgi:hypothetical protein